MSQCEETQTVMGAVGIGTTQQWVDLNVLLEPRTIETRICVHEAQKASCKNGVVIVAVLAQRRLWGVGRKPCVTVAVVTCGNVSTTFTSQEAIRNAHCLCRGSLSSAGEVGHSCDRSTETLAG